jgi:hypothetical protein
MRGGWLHRGAVLLSACAFVSVLTGTAVTNNEARPFYSFGQSHFWLGAGTGALTLALAVWIQASERRKWLRVLGWSAAAAVAVQAWLGLQPIPQPPAVRVAHAFLAQLVFPATVLIAAGTTERRRKATREIERSSGLRLIAVATPVVVLAQVVLGTLFRHGVLEVMPHLLGAFPTVSLILGLALPVIYWPEQHSLHLAARLLVTVAAVQVFLGMALFSMQAMDVDPPVMILVTMVHAATAALTLTATIVLAVLIYRRIHPTNTDGTETG